MALALQSRTTEHGAGRDHPETEVGHGGLILLFTSVKKGL